MLSASRILKSINLSRDVLSGVRLLSLHLSENVTINENGRNEKRWKSELEYLETNTRRYGRIDPFIFQNCVKTIKYEDLTTKQSLLLMKCCGPLMYNKHKEKRIQMLKELWNIFKDKQIPFDIMHYNLLIKMYIENDYDFNPQDILAEIKSMGLKPNLRTYEFIVNKYCIDGKLDQVTNLLESMNAEGLSLTAAMFDSLILGHFINKDVKTALETFELMKESNIDVTSSTYKNIIIGYLKNHKDVNNLVDKVKQLVDDNMVKFEAVDIERIFDSIPRKEIDAKDEKELKEFLITHIVENENVFNDITHFCYRLILNQDYNLVEKLFNQYFNDSQSKEYFSRCLTVSILKSDETSVRDFFLFLRDLYPDFNFMHYVRHIIRNGPYKIDKVISVINDVRPLLESGELGLLGLFVDKCENEDDLHKLTEHYLSCLEVSWINHIKINFLPRIPTDLIEFVKEHLKRNSNQESIELLKLSVFCTYFDQLEIDKLRQFVEEIRPNINLLSNKYLISRSAEVLEKQPDKLDSLLICLQTKLNLHRGFRYEFIKYCIENLEDGEKLRKIIEFYDLNEIEIYMDRFEERHMQRLKELFTNPNKANFEKLVKMIMNRENIEIDDNLTKFVNNLQIGRRAQLFRLALKNNNYELTNVFYDPRVGLNLPNVIRHVLLKLQNGEDKMTTIQYLDDRLGQMPNLKIISIFSAVDQIFDFVKDDKQVTYIYVNRISQHLDPERLYEHLSYFYSKTKDESIGQNLISLNKFLLNRNQINRVFRTMLLFIENKNTKLLQTLCDKLSFDQEIYTKSKIYQELALAFVFSKRYKQAIKVIQTDEFLIDNSIGDLIVYLINDNKKEIIKQYAILVYQNSTKSRKLLLRILSEQFTKLNQTDLFQDILLEIKKLSVSQRQKTTSDDEQILTNEQVESIESKKDEHIDEIIESVRSKHESKEEMIKLVDKVLNRKIELKLNVECDLIDRLMGKGELEKAFDLVYDMLRNERYPIPGTIKNFLKELSLKARTDLIEKLEAYTPVPLKESEFYKSNKIIAKLRNLTSDEQIKDCLNEIQIFSADLIDQILLIKPEFESKIISLLKQKKKSNLNYIWLSFMKNSKFDKALDLVEKNVNELNVQNLLFRPIINLVRQNNNIELARQLVNYSNKYELNENTVQSIYNVYMKSCLNADLIDEVKQTIEQHYKLRPDIKLEIQNLDEQLVAKLGQSFVEKYLNQ